MARAAAATAASARARRALAPGLGDEAVLELEQRLDREHLAEQRPRAADPAALDEVVEGVEHRADPEPVALGLGEGDELVERRAGRGALGDVDREQALGHRHRPRVDDAHVERRAR